MAKEKEYLFACDTCEQKYTKWKLKCSEPNCQGEIIDYVPLAAKVDMTGIKGTGLITASEPAQLMQDINVSEHQHKPTGIHEFDRVLGGGLIPGGTIILAGPPGTGKALTLDTRIFTAHGWKSLKDIIVGDRVLGLNGAFTNVVALSEVWNDRPLYAMDFGLEIIKADAAHEWVINTLEVMMENATPIIKTTQEIFEDYENMEKKYSFHRKIGFKSKETNESTSKSIINLLEQAMVNPDFNHIEAIKDFNYELLSLNTVIFDVFDFLIENQTIEQYEARLFCKSYDGFIFISELLHLMDYKTKTIDTRNGFLFSFTSDDFNRSSMQLKSIIKIESEPVKCIEVDNDTHTFLAGEYMIPTHNSSLLAHVSHTLSQEENVLYVSGEESIQQIRLRHKRMNAEGKNLYLASEQDLSKVLWQIEQVDPKLIIIDSMQTIASSEASSQAGTITQVNLVAQTLVRIAKTKHIPIIFVGHYTKDGNVAGPRTVEHLVDVVLGFEGERDSPLRLLRGIKNRYGPSDEIGCFQHTENGLEEVLDPSGLLMGDRDEDVVGVMTSIFLEGNRALPLEIQSLVVATGSPNPKRSTIGLDNNKTIQMQAVLQKYGAGHGMNFQNYDIYVQVIGGMTVKEPAVDLATIISIASSKLDVSTSQKTVAIGLVSVSGEIRQAVGMTKRLTEAARLGFTSALVPRGTRELVKNNKNITEKMVLIELNDVSQVVQYLVSTK